MSVRIESTGAADRGAASLPVLDLAAAGEAMDHDASIFLEVAQVFLDDFPKLVAAIRDATDRADARALQRAAHTFKGASAAVGGKRAAALAASLEAIARAGRVAGAAEGWDALRAAADDLCGALRRVVEAGRVEGW